MASKNLGAVIQRAISDGAFRRQLQSDPAAALRGFNLTPDEVKAIRSGDSSKLMSLGVDQRMSKMFTVFGLLGATRATTSDLNPGGSANALSDPTLAGTRTIINDVASFGTAAQDSASSEAASGGNMIAADDNYAVSSRMADAGDLSGTRAVNDVAPFEGNVNAAAGSEVIPTDELRAMEHNVGGDAASTIVPSSTGETGNEHGWG